MNTRSKELYCNLTPLLAAYAYPRPFHVDPGVDGERKRVTRAEDGGVVNIALTGVPDGVPPITNETLVPAGSPRRLYVFSDQPLSMSQLRTIDGFYGKRPYPIAVATVPCARLPPGRVPRNNFSLILRTNAGDNDGTMNFSSDPDDRQPISAAYAHQPCSLSGFIEYRYLQARHVAPSIGFHSLDGHVYRLVLPGRQQMIVLIMPENFVATGLKRGFFRFDDGLIAHVFSSYPLAATRRVEQDDLAAAAAAASGGNAICEISVIDTADQRLMDVIKGFFARIGMHRILSSAPNQVYAYDRFLTVVVGSTANIVLPRTL